MTEKEAWPNEGTLHSDVRPDALFLNATVKAFLNSDRRTILIASKGMGKTLLLRAKKKLLASIDSGVRLVPQNGEYDVPTFMGELERGVFRDRHLWQCLWQASIVFSAVSYHWVPQSEYADSDPPEVRERKELLFRLIDELEIGGDFKESLREDVRWKQRQLPSYYLGKFLGKSAKSLIKFSRSMFAVQRMSMEYIQDGVSFFIDNFDQMLERHFQQELETWKNAQLGLLKAIHKLNTDNPHLKVYASIRQEAFAGFEDPDREVIRGRSVLLEYSRDDLEGMFKHAIKRYSKKQTMDEFFGTTEIHNQVYGVPEKPFNYVYRHSTGTPRSIMGFGHDLNTADYGDYEHEEAEKTIRAVVNRAAATNVFDDYFVTQRQFFLSTLSDRDRVDTLFSLIPTNILSGRDLQAINREFAKRSGLNPDDSHPFCELHNLGLLGTTEFDLVNNATTQVFKKPYQFQWKHHEIVKLNRCYFLHPSLHAAVRSCRPDYQLNRHVLIGDGESWPHDEPPLPLIFLSHSSLDTPLLTPFAPQLCNKMSLRCPIGTWFDEINLGVGARIVSTIEHAVSKSDLMLVFLSKASLASKWVEREWETKYLHEVESGNVCVICVLLNDIEVKDIPDALRGKKAIQLPAPDSSGFDAQLDKLCRDLADILFKSSYFRAANVVSPI